MHNSNTLKFDGHRVKAMTLDDLADTLNQGMFVHRVCLAAHCMFPEKYQFIHKLVNILNLLFDIYFNIILH